LNFVESIDQSFIEQLYTTCKPQFFSMAKQYAIDNATLTDIYQDAMVAFIEQWQNKKLQNIQTSHSTYLLAIAKYMLYKKLKIANKEASIVAQQTTTVWDEYDVYEKEEAVIKMSKAFAKLGEQCKKLLHLFYYEQKKLDDIVPLMQYENKDVAKSQKYKCIQHLKNFVKHG
jgi:RNA polymerase sigma factor (sigma-70 family)